MREMKDCKTCVHSIALFERGKEGRFETLYKPSGFVRCCGPRYKGRRFFVRDSRTDCPDYAKRDRRGGGDEPC